MRTGPNPMSAVCGACLSAPVVSCSGSGTRVAHPEKHGTDARAEHAAGPPVEIDIVHAEGERRIANRLGRNSIGVHRGSSLTLKGASIVLNVIHAQNADTQTRP